MTPSAIETGLQQRSLVRSSGELELSLAEIPVPRPGTAERPVVTASIPARADEGHGRPRGSAASRRQRRGGRGRRATGEKYLISPKKAISR
jgi:hypothetical protein